MKLLLAGISDTGKLCFADGENGTYKQYAGDDSDGATRPAPTV